MSESIKQNGSMWRQVITGAMTVLLGYSLGFGTSQMVVGQKTEANAIEIQHMRDRMAAAEQRSHEEMQETRKALASILEQITEIRVRLAREKP